MIPRPDDLTPEQWQALWALTAAVEDYMTSDPMAKSCQGDSAERVRHICATYALTIRTPWREWRAAMGEPVPDVLEPSPLSLLLCENPKVHRELERELLARDEMLSECMEEVARLARALSEANRLDAPAAHIGADHG